MQFQTGNTPWTKGRKFTDEHRARLRASNIGKKRSLETRLNMSRARKNVPISDSHRENIRIAVTLGYQNGTRRVGSTKGAVNGNWKGGVSRENKTARQLDMETVQYKQWRKTVFERDNYTCQGCGQIGGKLQADHELPYATFPELRFEILNGRTLCEACHKKTPTFGVLALSI